MWYSRLKIDDISTAYSLVDARYGKYANTVEEKQMVLNFQRLLKDNQSLNYRRILLYHFLAGMTSNMDFDNIELFGMIPSSNGDVNTYVFDFMTHVSASLLMLLSVAHPVCLASEKNSCPAFS